MSIIYCIYNRPNEIKSAKLEYKLNGFIDSVTYLKDRKTFMSEFNVLKCLKRMCFIKIFETRWLDGLLNVSFSMFIEVRCVMFSKD